MISVHLILIPVDSGFQADPAMWALVKLGSGKISHLTLIDHSNEC